MRNLANKSVVLAAVAVGALFAREAAAADPLMPHDESVYDAKTLVGMACSKCHGVNGVSISPLYPILAAQQPMYIEAQLKLFRMRARSDPHARAFMWGIAQRLNDEQIEGLAQYFSSQPHVTSKPSRDPALAAKGNGKNVGLLVVVNRGDDSGGHGEAANVCFGNR